MLWRSGLGQLKNHQQSGLGHLKNASEGISQSRFDTNLQKSEKVQGQGSLYYYVDKTHRRKLDYNQI